MIQEQIEAIMEVLDHAVVNGDLRPEMSEETLFEVAEKVRDAAFNACGTETFFAPLWLVYAFKSRVERLKNEIRAKHSAKMPDEIEGIEELKTKLDDIKFKCWGDNEWRELHRLHCSLVYKQAPLHLTTEDRKLYEAFLEDIIEDRKSRIKGHTTVRMPDGEFVWTDSMRAQELIAGLEFRLKDVRGDL